MYVIVPELEWKVHFHFSVESITFLLLFAGKKNDPLEVLVVLSLAD